MRPGRAVVGALLVAVVACGTGSDGSTTSIVPTTALDGSGVTSTTRLDTGTTLGPTTITSTTEIADEIVIELIDEGGLQVVGPDAVQVPLGETVEITIRSSVDGEVHVHGYDLFFDLAAGGEATIRFVVDVPGIFEVELEGDHLLLFELEVRP